MIWLWTLWSMRGENSSPHMPTGFSCQHGKILTNITNGAICTCTTDFGHNAIHVYMYYKCMLGMFLSILIGYVETYLQDLHFQSKFEFSMLKLHKERGCSIIPISPLPSSQLCILLHQAKALEIFRKSRTQTTMQLLFDHISPGSSFAGIVSKPTVSTQQRNSSTCQCSTRGSHSTSCPLLHVNFRGKGNKDSLLPSALNAAARQDSNLALRRVPKKGLATVLAATAGPQGCEARQLWGGAVPPASYSLCCSLAAGSAHATSALRKAILCSSPCGAGVHLQLSLLWAGRVAPAAHTDSALLSSHATKCGSYEIPGLALL